MKTSFTVTSLPVDSATQGRFHIISSEFLLLFDKYHDLITEKLLKRKISLPLNFRFSYENQLHCPLAPEKTENSPHFLSRVK
jgi:hypothetical protein